MKKALKIAGGVLLALVAGLLIFTFYQFPYCLKNKEIVEVNYTGKDAAVKVMSFNIRLFTPQDMGKRHWFYRADLVADTIEKQAPGVIGFQEVTPIQYKYLCDTLKGYDSIMTYRDKSPNSEGCPVFYLEELYTLVDKGSFWLSETPEVMSRDWGSACYRITSYVILTDNVSGKDFVVFNTHLDHVSDEARIKGMGVILDKIAQFGGLPAVIMGDLNAQEDSATILAATEHFLDARYAAEETVDTYTYQNWGNMSAAVRIDYFMISKTGIRPLRYAVLDQPRDGVWSSDHSPIVLTMELE